MKQTVFFISLFISIFVTAQAPRLHFQYMSQKDGLSNTFVTCMAQDSSGYIWIGTVEGLSRFDGQNFNNYRPNGNKGELPHQYINGLLCDSKGVVWVATSDGLASYQPDSDQFEVHHFEGKVDGDVVRADFVLEDKGGFIYASERNLIYRLNRATGEFELFYQVASGKITSMAFDEGNTLWIATAFPSAIISYHVQSSREIIYQPGDLGLSTFPVSSIVVRQNLLWIGTVGDGLMTLDLGTRKFSRVDIGIRGAEFISRLYVDHQNHLWMVDYTGLKFYDDLSRQFTPYYPRLNTPTSIKHEVSGIFNDNQGNYWVYHNLGGVGLSVLPKGFVLINNNTDEDWHLSNNRVTAIGDDGVGNLWIAHSGFGIDIFNWKEQRVDHINHGPDKSMLRSIMMIYRDRNNTMWIGSYRCGLLRYNPSKKAFEGFLNDPDNPQSIANNDVRSMVMDQQGYYWLATHGAGVDRFDVKKNTFVHFTSENSNLSNPWTYQLLIDKHQNLWVATAWGLNKKAKDSNRFVNYFNEKNDSTSISGNNVISLFEDKEGVIWVGIDNGLCRYNEATNNFTRVGVDALKGAVNGITEDAMGYLWISTLKGLSRISKTTYEVRHFDAGDGVQSDEFLPRSVYKNIEGKMFFGGISGITTFNPHQIRFNTIPPPVVITGLKLDGEEITPSHASGILKKDIRRTDAIRIGYKYKVLTISFNAINFNNPNRNQYRVMLDGFDDTWQNTQGQTMVTYTNLDPGTYVFRVKAANNDGVWNEVGTSLSIQITPPWYATIWFRLFIVLMVTGMVWGLLKLRTHHLLRRQEQLTRQVKEKTEEIEASNQELMAQAEYLDNLNKLLEERQGKLENQSRLVATQAQTLRKQNDELKQLNKTKDRLFSIIAHDLINPFNSIIGLSEVFKEEYDHLTDKERIELMTTVNISANRIFALLQNLLLWARNQTNSVKFMQVSFILKGVLLESTDFLSETLLRKGLSLTIDCPENLSVYADSDMVKTIVRNLVSNAIKFSYRDGEIAIVCTTKDTKVMVEVKDNGMGMTRDTVNQLLSMQTSHTSSGTEGEPGTGLGLLICKEFVDWHKGEFTISSKPGKGSTFMFSLPLSSSGM
jgi:signal transduction histidine kinase/ligand-binding sensor domain-containing protein